MFGLGHDYILKTDNLLFCDSEFKYRFILKHTFPSGLLSIKTLSTTPEFTVYSLYN